MSDPLGLIGAVGKTSQPGGQAPLAGADSKLPSFKDALMRNIDEINKLQQDAAKATEDMVAGKGNYETMLLATNKADIAFKMMQAVRNQVIRAYEEVQQMRV